MSFIYMLFRLRLVVYGISFSFILSCSKKERPIAIFKPNECTIETTLEEYKVYRIVFYEKDTTINKVSNILENDFTPMRVINICEILRQPKSYLIEKISFFSVYIKTDKKKNFKKGVVRTEAQLLDKNTTILVYQMKL